MSTICIEDFDNEYKVVDSKEVLTRSPALDLGPKIRIFYLDVELKFEKVFHQKLEKKSKSEIF